MSEKSDAEQAALLAYILPGEVSRAVEALRQAQETAERLAKLTGKMADELEYGR